MPTYGLSLSDKLFEAELIAERVALRVELLSGLQVRFDADLCGGSN